MAETIKMTWLQQVGKALAQQVWYHGFMPREDCEELIKLPGDFIVRRTQVYLFIYLFILVTKHG